MFDMHPDLLIAQQIAYLPAGLTCSDFAVEPESKEYSACRFIINNKRAVFRSAKITPTKVGQFVTFWKRSAAGPIAPFDLSDPVDFFIVSVRSGNNFGQFIFPKSVLIEQGFASKNHIGGKRAMRVYPPWDKADNRQAIKTQAWQLHYFFDMDVRKLDLEKIKRFFLNKEL